MFLQLNWNKIDNWIEGKRRELSSLDEVENFKFSQSNFAESLELFVMYMTNQMEKSD